jgi:hypothetical protein
MNRARFLFGLGLLTVGALLLFDAFGTLDAGHVISTWWPAALIVIGGTMALTNPRHLLMPGIVAGAGVILLLNRLDVISVGWEIVWPAALVLLGIGLLFGRPGITRVEDDRVDAFAAFGGTEVASHSKHFEGGTVGALFGGAEIDLRDAELAPDASLDVFTAFGGAEVKVPQGWKVITHGLPLFGGFENITNKEALPDDAPTLDIAATVLFGGLEVKH